MKKFLKRLVLFLLAVLLLAQIPFAYRRYQNGQIWQRLKTEQEVAANTPKRVDPDFNEYKGVVHVHTALGGHSTGGFDELISAANANDLDFVLMTEHTSDYDTAALTLNGVHGKALFIGGNEIDTADRDRFLMIPGSDDAAGMRKLSTKAVVEKLHSENRLAMIVYPEKFRSWDTDFDGTEVFSVHTNSKKINPGLAIGDGLWSFPAYPALMIAGYFKRPDTELKQFDEIAAKRRVTLFGGSDAHSNIGVQLFSDNVGHNLIRIKIDPYEMIFRLVRMHILIAGSKPLTKESLIEAVKNGNFFTGFDVIGDSDGFSFKAENGKETKIMGDEIALTQATKLTAASPQPARFVVFKNGEHFYEAAGTAEMSVNVTEPAVYRVEVYRNDLGSPFDKAPWIMSNPIYIR